MGGGAVGNINAYNNFAIKYVLLAMVLALGIPYGWRRLNDYIKEPTQLSQKNSTGALNLNSKNENFIRKLCRVGKKIPSKIIGRDLSKTEVIIFWAVVLLSVGRIWLAYNTPVYIIGNSAHDDAYYRDMATSILNGEWLGEYSQFTLMKGNTYALFYVICIITRIPYTILLALFHIVSALVFVRTIRCLLKFRYAGYLLYLLLIFSPATFSSSISQRLYRNALVVPFVLLIFAGMTGLYLNLDKWKSARRYSILAGVCLFLFWNLREDAIWIMPFVICAGMISFIFSVVSYRKSRDKKLLIKKTAAIVLPLVILLAGNFLISSINYSYYGIFARNDRTEGVFSDVVGLFIQIDCDEDDPDVDEDYCYMTYEKFEYIIDHSESLSEYKEILLDGYSSWAEGIFSDIYVPGDHIQWAFRLGLQNAGFYTDAAETQAYLKQVREELETAISNEELQIKDGIFLSSSSKMLELREIPEYLIKTVTKSLPEIVLYSNTAASATESTGDESVIRDWEWRINSYALYPDEEGDRLEYASSITVFENKIIKVYQITAIPVFGLAILSFLGLSVSQILNIKRKDKHLFDNWLFPCGAGLSMILLLFLLTFFDYNDKQSVTFFGCASFCLCQIFEIISICGGLFQVINYIRSRKQLPNNDYDEYTVGKENIS